MELQGTRSKPRARKVTRAFKIAKDLDDAIVLHSERRGITPSSFINQLLIEYFDWWQFASKGSTFLTIDRRLFVSMIEELDEEKILDLARSVALITGREFMKYRLGKVDTDSALAFLRLTGAHMNWGELSIIEGEHGTVEIMVRHDLGIKWSLFLSEFVSNLLSSFLAMRTTSEFSTYGCSVRGIHDGKGV